MAFSLAGHVEIRDPACVGKTFPRYFDRPRRPRHARLTCPRGHSPPRQRLPPTSAHWGALWHRPPAEGRRHPRARAGRPTPPPARPAAPDGRSIHVPGAFPGEQASVRLTHVSRQHPRAHAELRARSSSPHPARRDPPLRPPPPASPARVHRLPPAPARRHDPARLQAELLARTFGLHVDRVVASPEEFGYRWSSKRVVGGRPGALTLGSYTRGTHQIVEMDSLPRRPPGDRRSPPPSSATSPTPSTCSPTPTSATPGLKPTAATSCSPSSPATTTAAPPATSRIACDLPAASPGPCSRARATTSAANPPTILRGRGDLTLDLAGVRVTVGPLGFLQPNPAAAALAYHDLLRTEQGAPLTGALAFDLYAGAGVTTDLLRQQFTEVRACESYPESAAALGLAPETAESFLQRARDVPDLVVANPPREGLGPTSAPRWSASPPRACTS
jgi:23S rRNA (uracil1939-C5)-methyltransferase